MDKQVKTVLIGDSGHSVYPGSKPCRPFTENSKGPTLTIEGTLLQPGIELDRLGNCILLREIHIPRIFSPKELLTPLCEFMLQNHDHNHLLKNEMNLTIP